MAENEAMLAAVTSILRMETCTCGARPDPTDVPLDNTPGHHDFSCRFREIMQPVLKLNRLPDVLGVVSNSTHMGTTHDDPKELP